MATIKKHLFRVAALILFPFIILLSGCGGGGGNAPLPPPAPNLQSIAVTPALPTVMVGSTQQFIATGTYADGTSAVLVTGVLWGSSDTSIVTVNTSGLATGVGAGTATIRATSGTLSGSVTLTVTSSSAAALTDPLYPAQWHLKNTGQLGANGVAGVAGEDINVEPVWVACGGGNTCRGEGVLIAVVDNGLEIAHEDLAANVATGLSYNYLTSGTDPTEAPGDMTPGNGHGTRLAGIIAARDLNGLGVRGVAPRANLVGYNLLQDHTNINAVDAITRGAAAVSISSNSYGPPDNGDLHPATLPWMSAINTGLATGRGGLGTVYVWAAGNGGDGSTACPTCRDNSNYDGQANFRGVIAVAAVKDNGVYASYSERGANLWVSAPAGESCDTHTITTTDRTGAVGNNPPSPGGGADYADDKYTRCMNGTSAAVPMISGVVALVLQANPTLGWRDVREILAHSARKNAPLSGDWSVNGAGLNVSHDYGFGVVDAHAAVTLAKTWVNLPAEKTWITGPSAVNLTIPDNNLSGVSNAITVTGSGITHIEHVEITFSASDHTYAGDLEISLVNVATGTISLLAESHNCDGVVCAPHNSWVFSSTRHLGEAADGDWLLIVRDRARADIGTFQSWALKFYGH